MDEEEKKKIVNDANKTIDEISSNSKDYINKLDDNDLKVIKELGEIIDAFKKHKSFWKIVLGVSVVVVFLNFFYYIGVIFGKFLANIL